jgi:hypothetical protein
MIVSASVDRFQKGNDMRNLALVLSLALVGCGGSSDTSGDNVETGGAYDEAKQIAWNERGQDAIKAKLKDPDSAQFRNVEFHSAVAPVTCGEVNTKNSFGGYSGFERFIAGGDVITVLESEMAAGEMDKAWAQICVG